MENITSENVSETNQQYVGALEKPGAILQFFSWTFVALSIALVFYGLHKMYDYDGIKDDTKIVGGDAYNYIIIATRSTAWVCAGVCSAVLSATLAVLSNRAARS